MLKSLIPKLANHRVLVIGDVILDEYLTGRATRMSREAPVPVLEYEDQRFIPGGAGNPAANIVALGSHVMQLGLVGDDDFAEHLRQALRERGIDIAHVLTDTSRPTTVKTRIMAHMGLRFPQQVARLDRISRAPIDKTIEDTIRARLQATISQVDAVLVSDYHCGLLTPSLVDHIRGMAGSTLLTADAQGELGKYRGFGLVKCNADEAATFLNRELSSHQDFAQAASDLFSELQLTGAMVITRGADGASIATSDGTAHCPAPTVVDVYDTVGAGDTAIAVQTLAVLAGASYAQAVTLANYASGLVVRRVGNYSPTPDELSMAVQTWEIKNDA